MDDADKDSYGITMNENTEYNILIVDDEKHITDILSLYLQRINKLFNIKVAHNGIDALSIYHEFIPKICILDINLPGKSGIDVLKEIHLLNPMCKIIMISGSTSPHILTSVLRFGALDFLDKPIIYDEFATCVIRAINEYESLIKFHNYHEFLKDQNFKKFDSLISITFNVLSSISKICELKDPYTSGHMERVAYISKVIGCTLNLTSNEIKYLHIGSLLHDIGKISIPIEILNKPSKLSTNEFNLIKDHCINGYDIIKDIPFDILYDYDITKLILHHHERLDGSGYPLGLVDKQIDDLTRIISISDVIESVSAMRPYRPALGLDAAISILNDGRGTLYDSSLIDVVTKLMNKYSSINHFFNEPFQFPKIDFI